MHIKHKAVQDMLMLTKWNKQNASMLVQNDDWHYWLLSLLLDMPDRFDTGLAILDIGARVHTTVMKQAVIGDEDGWKYIRRMMNWFDANKSRERARSLIKKLFEGLTENLQADEAECKNAQATFLWKNLVITSYLIEEFVLQSTAGGNAGYKHLFFSKEQWENASLMDVFFKLLDLIRPHDLMVSLESRTA